jgi:uncharacterized pyridoxamine 5'-phosphate oxidase family protein
MTIGGRPAIIIEVKETINSAKKKVRMLQFMLIHNRKLYCLQESFGTVEASKNLELQIKKHEPLFRLIAAKTQIAN